MLNPGKILTQRRQGAGRQAGKGLRFNLAPLRLGVSFLLSCSLIGMLGCGGKTAPVKGQMKLKDGGDVSQLARYIVQFEPEGGRTSGTGEIQPDGTFQITTFAPNDGALPGKHRVAVSPPQSPDPDKPPPKPAIARKYFDFSTSGLSVEIKPGKNDVVLELDRAP
jgi:hypothetical protein